MTGDFSLLGMILHSAGILEFHCIKAFIRGFFLDSIAAQIPNPFGLLSPLWIPNDELALYGTFISIRLLIPGILDILNAHSGLASLAYLLNQELIQLWEFDRHRCSL